MLELRDIGLKFFTDEKENHVLKGISLSFDRGKLYALTGPNGSGKSSLARVIMGIHHPDAGNIIYKGEDITALGIAERARKGIGYAFQQPPHFKGLRVTDILEIALRRSDNHAVSYTHLDVYKRQPGNYPQKYAVRPP